MILSGDKKPKNSRNCEKRSFLQKQLNFNALEGRVKNVEMAKFFAEVIFLVDITIWGVETENQRTLFFFGTP